GCERSKPSRNCAPSSSHSPGAIMKLGSPRGMDTKRPRGSERSKPCHESQLTRRSQPPYPWPHEQAQPGVSKPCRTTLQVDGYAAYASLAGDKKTSGKIRLAFC